MSAGLMVKASLYVFAPVIMTKAAIPVFQFHYRKKKYIPRRKDYCAFVSCFHGFRKASELIGLVVGLWPQVYHMVVLDR